MTKDPAFLFYPSDYLGGTMGMTFEQKGAYVELLMAQFNRGHMSGHMVGQVLGQSYGQIWEVIKIKFIKDDNGLYYNQRLEDEQGKRKSFTNSRKNNLEGKNQCTKPRGHMDGHLTSHMEDVNENELLDYSIIEKELSNSEIWLSDISMNYKIDINLIRKHLSDFIKNQRVKKPGKRLLSDVRKHFNNTLRIKLNKQGCSTVKKEKTYDELIAEREERLATNRKLADEKVAELGKSV